MRYIHFKALASFFPILSLEKKKKNCHPLYSLSFLLWTPWFNSQGFFFFPYVFHVYVLCMFYSAFNFTSAHVNFLKNNKNNVLWTSPVVPWLRICLPMQGTRVCSLVRQDHTCCSPLKPVCHNYWVSSLEPRGCIHVYIYIYVYIYIKLTNHTICFFKVYNLVAFNGNPFQFSCLKNSIDRGA